MSCPTCVSGFGRWTLRRGGVQLPNGDTVVVDSYLAGHDYHALLRQRAIGFAGGDVVRGGPSQVQCEVRKDWSRSHGLKARPVDKKEHYVKRCVGCPAKTCPSSTGSWSSTVRSSPPPGLQFNYLVRLKREADLKVIRERRVDRHRHPARGRAARTSWRSGRTRRPRWWTRASWRRCSHTTRRARRGTLDMYPNTNTFDFSSWDLDNYGPIHLPAAGETLALTPRNLALYERVITAYEGHDLRVEGDAVLIDGEAVSEYTFEQGYWMMGDNRHSSADSRYWGFVPEDHVGRAAFTWFSKMNEAQHGESGIRWDRMFAGALSVCPIFCFPSALPAGALVVCKSC